MPTVYPPLLEALVSGCISRAFQAGPVADQAATLRAAADELTSYADEIDPPTTAASIPVVVVPTVPTVTESTPVTDPIDPAAHIPAGPIA